MENKETPLAEKRIEIDWEDKMLFLMGIYVPYYWILKNVRREIIKGNISQKEALEFLGVKNV